MEEGEESVSDGDGDGDGEGEGEGEGDSTRRVNLLVRKEGEWEAALAHEQHHQITREDVWSQFFTKNATDWFKQEAGEMLIKKNYASNMEWGIVP